MFKQSLFNRVKSIYDNQERRIVFYRISSYKQAYRSLRSAQVGIGNSFLPLVFLVAMVDGSGRVAGEKKTRKYRGSSRVREQSRY